MMDTKMSAFAILLMVIYLFHHFIEVPKNQFQSNTVRYNVIKQMDSVIFHRYFSLAIS